MKKNSSNNKWLLIFFSVLIIIVPAVIIYLLFNDMIRNDIGMSLISYAGSVLGGLLTLIGVLWTIKFTDEIRKKDLQLQYRPFLSYSIENYTDQYKRVGELVLIFNNEYFNDVDLYTDTHMIKMKNTGKGDIDSLKFSVDEVGVVTSDFLLGNKNQLLESSYFLGNNYLNFLLSNDEAYIVICLPKYKNIYSETDFKLIILSINLDIEYTGLLSTESYVQTLTLNLSIKYNEENKEYITSVYNTSMDNKTNSKASVEK